MQEKLMPKDKEITLQPLYLTLEEEEVKRKEYQDVISKIFPGANKITQEEFRFYKANIHKEDSIKILKNVALSSVFDQVTYIFLHYCVNGYDFEDMIQEMYILVENKFLQYVNGEFLSEFKFFFDRFAFREVMARLNRMSKKNIDLAYANIGMLEAKEDIDKVSLNKPNVCEYKILSKDFFKDVNKYLSKLSPKYQKVLIMYYGLNNTPALKMHEIAEKFCVTRSMIQKHISNALKELENLKEDDCLKDYKDGFEF